MVHRFLFPVSCAGGSPSSSSSPPVKPQAEGTSDLTVDAYYNFYQPSRYPAYYNNLYSYQQYPVTAATHRTPAWLSVIAMTPIVVIIIVNKNIDVIPCGGLYPNTK